MQLRATNSTLEQLLLELFSTLCSRAPRVRPRRIFVPLLSKRSFAYSRLRICPSRRVFHGRFCLRNLPPLMRTHGLAFFAAFPLVCSGTVRRGSAAGRAPAAVETLCWTAVGARRCRKDAAQPGNSGVPRLGEGCDALLRAAQLESNPRF